LSLGVAFKGPEGIVLAVDSRVTLSFEQQIPNGVQIIPATYDNATKLLKFNGQKHVGAITYGLGALGTTAPRTAHSFVPEFEDELARELEKIKDEKARRLSVDQFAGKLSDFFMRQWNETNAQHPGIDMVFVVGGYDKGDAYGKIFDFYIPSRPKPEEQNEDTFGVLWGGQRELVDRLLDGFDPTLPFVVQEGMRLTDDARTKLATQLKSTLSLAIPYQFLPLQDCVDFSAFLIRTTIELQTWIGGVRGVGGAIDIATITRTDGFTPIREKKIAGESIRNRF
jgi:hypothetical protein